MPPEQVVARVRARLAQDRRVVGRNHRRTIFLTVHPRANHFWSPELHVQLAKADGGTRLTAMFAPSPQVWGIFVSLQILAVILSVAAASYVAAVLLIGNDPTKPLLALGGCVAAGALSYGSAWVGQGLGAKQMRELRAFLERALADR